MAVTIARTGLIAAAQGAGLLPTQPGGPANPAFAAAAGITLPAPPQPKEVHRSWLERRLDDVGHAASWAWGQAKQVPGGTWEGTKGIYDGARFIVGLNPTDPANWMHPERMLQRYEQLGTAGKLAVEHPGEFGKALINYDDLAAGRYGEWAGNLVPDASLAVATGGAGAAATRSTRIAKATSKLAEAERAFNRAVEIQDKMPVKRFRLDKTVAAQAGDRGAVSISGESFQKQATILARAGVDPGLLKTQSADEIRAAMESIAKHEMPAHPWDPPSPKGWYYSTHAELRLLLHDARVPIGVTRRPCLDSCDPGIQSLAAKLKQDIVIRSPDGATLYKADGTVIRHAQPKDFSGLNSRWPGVLWGTGGGAVTVGASSAGP